jgi:hypothetical protein
MPRRPRAGPGRRSSARGFCRMRARCVSTVRGLIQRRRPTSAVGRPSTVRSKNFPLTHGESGERRERRLGDEQRTPVRLPDQGPGSYTRVTEEPLSRAVNPKTQFERPMIQTRREERFRNRARDRVCRESRERILAGRIRGLTHV